MGSRITNFGTWNAAATLYLNMEDGQWRNLMSTNDSPFVLASDETNELLGNTEKETDEMVKFLVYRNEFKIELGAIRLLHGESQAGALMRQLSKKNIDSVPITEMCSTILGYCSDNALSLNTLLKSRIEKLGDNIPESNLAAVEEVVGIIRELVLAGFTLAVEGAEWPRSELMWYSSSRSRFEGNETILAYLRPNNKVA